MNSATLSKTLESLGVTRYTFAGSPETEEEFYASFQITESVDEDTGAVVYADPTSYSFTWAELQARYATVAVEVAWEDLRVERDRLLAETDWWASSDRTMTAEQTAYRQALRDLPANTADPANPIWPTKP